MPSGQQEPDPLEILGRSAKRYESMSAFCTRFRQRLSVPLLDQVTDSEGELCQRPPGYFLMRFSHPEGDLVVIDGEYLWVYFPSTDPGVVFRSRPDAAGARLDFHQEFLANPAEKYAVAYGGTEDVGGNETHVLELVPRGPSDYRGARVWLDAKNSLLRRVEIEELNESLRTVELEGLRVDPSLEEDTFRFTPPKGVQIVHR